MRSITSIRRTRSWRTARSNASATSAASTGPRPRSCATANRPVGKAEIDLGCDGRHPHQDARQRRDEGRRHAAAAAVGRRSGPRGVRVVSTPLRRPRRAQEPHAQPLQHRSDRRPEARGRSARAAGGRGAGAAGRAGRNPRPRQGPRLRAPQGRAPREARRRHAGVDAAAALGPARAQGAADRRVRGRARVQAERTQGSETGPGRPHRLLGRGRRQPRSARTTSRSGRPRPTARRPRSGTSSSPRRSRRSSRSPTTATNSPRRRRRTRTIRANRSRANRARTARRRRPTRTRPKASRATTRPPGDARQRRDAHAVLRVGGLLLAGRPPPGRDAGRGGSRSERPTGRRGRGLPQGSAGRRRTFDHADAGRAVRDGTYHSFIPFACYVAASRRGRGTGGARERQPRQRACTGTPSSRPHR